MGRGEQCLFLQCFTWLCESTEVEETNLQNKHTKINIHTNKFKHNHTNTHKEEQTHKQVHKQTDKQREKKTETNTRINTEIKDEKKCLS